MDFLWSPWRYDYLASGGSKPSSCVFCVTEDTSHDEERLIVYRGLHNFVILNLFPYTSGHTMIAPYQHLDTIASASAEQLTEMMQRVNVAPTIQASRDAAREELNRAAAAAATRQPGPVIASAGLGR